MKTKNIMTRCAALMAAALMAAGCQKDMPQIEKQPDYSNLRFEVSVGAKGDYDGSNGGGGAVTRAVKPGWMDYDRIMVFFDGSSENVLLLYYDASEGWVPDGDSEITSLAPSGTAQAIHTANLYLNDDMMYLGDDMIFTDAGRYTFDGETVRLTLDMNRRITSRITVEGLTDNILGWQLSGPGLNVMNSNGMSTSAFEGSFAAMLPALFESGNANAYWTSYNAEGSVSFFVLDDGTQEGTMFMLRNGTQVFVRTYPARELTPGKAVVIQGPEGAEAGLWTDLTADVAALNELVYEASDLDYYNYTEASRDAAQNATEAAHDLLYNRRYFTAEQLTAALDALRTALDGLVERPYRAPAEIYVDGLLNGVRYVSAGNHLNVYAYVYDANGEPSTVRTVDFEWNTPSWIIEPNIGDQWIQGMVDEAVAPGSSVQVTAISRDKQTVRTTFTIKVAGEGEIRTLFIDAVNALPAPADIDLEDYDALNAADDIKNAIWSLGGYNEDDTELMAAMEKLQACWDVYESLPIVLNYSFSGNTCTITAVDGYSVSFEYVKNGDFPCGTYTAPWEQEDDYFYQQRITFYSDDTYIEEYRDADDGNGTNATPWEQEGHGTYTYTGTQSSGGTMTLDYDYYYDDVDGDVGGGMRSSAPSARPHRIFKR